MDRVESLSSGEGRLDLSGFLRGGLESGSAGLGLDYEQRISQRWSAFSQASLGRSWGGSHGWKADVIGGARFRW